MVRTRIAPSPTGYPHIGTIYQALFDYAFTHRFGGQFIVRIEDTDQARLVEDAEQKIFEALDWFHLTEDESSRRPGKVGPYRQSERLDIYKKCAEELLEKGHAYYCFCSKERLDEVRKNMQSQGRGTMYDKHCRNLTKEEVMKKLSAGEPAVIRMKVPDSTKIAVHDLIRGEIVFDSASVDDQVLMKSDGFPTYHLAVVVDDHLMQITHMVRGEEWISSSPKQILLYDFFGWEKPIFFHTPLLRNPDKSKFSKRHGHTNVSWYQEKGFLPDAILNYMALMGWSHPQEKEIFSMEEFIQVFDLKDVKPVGPIFDLKKLEWINGQYIMKSEVRSLKSKVFEFYKGELPEDIIEKTIPLVRERIKTLSDYLPLCEFLFKKPVAYEVDLSSHKQQLASVRQSLADLDQWKADKIGEVMLKTAQELGIKNGVFFMVMRVAITGKKISPPLNESMEILSKKECLSRLQAAASFKPDSLSH